MTPSTRLAATVRSTTGSVARSTAAATRSLSAVALGLALAVALFATTAAAHTGSLSLGQEPAPVPTWLVVMTGGGVIGMSFLFASLVTDHDLIREINHSGFAVPALGALRRAGRLALRWASVLLLVATVVVGLFGPQSAQTNVAVLFVWAGWWAGYTATVYAIGNSWPALNPWRAIAGAIPVGSDSRRRLPDGLGPWPAVVGLLALIWFEVIAPVADDPRLLAGVVVAYSVVTVAGAVTFGPDPWFGRIDPVARVFACYGWIAPVQRTADGGIELRLPGAAAADVEAREAASPAFVIAVLWATTYDGVVSTPAWRSAVEPVVGAGVPAHLVYLLAIVVGYGAFLGLYRGGARLVRRTGDTYLDGGTIADEFATSLLPIAAGYHAAHFLAYVLSLLPAIAVLATRPFSPPATVPILTLPDWFSAVGLLFILVGHVVAIWIAHSVAFDLFAGRLQPLRSQYPLVALMIAYTMTSMWIVIQPTLEVPFV